MEGDINVLKQISNKEINVKTFDYDGKRFKSKDSKQLLKNLEIESEVLTEKIKHHDAEIFRYFESIEHRNDDNKLENLYDEFFSYDRAYEKKEWVCIRLSNELEFINEVTTFKKIEKNFNSIKSLEKELKDNIQKMESNILYEPELTKEIKLSFERYLSREWIYFSNETYNDNNLGVLYDAMNYYSYLLSRGYFLLKKNLLDYQAGLVHTSKPYTANA